MYKDYFPQPKISVEPKDPIGKRIREYYRRQFQLVKRMKRFIWKW